MWASIWSNTITNLYVVFGAYFLNRFAFKFGEGQLVALAAFVYICSSEMLLNLMGDLMHFFDLWTISE